MRNACLQAVMWKTHKTAVARSSMTLLLCLTDVDNTLDQSLLAPSGPMVDMLHNVEGTHVATYEAHS